MAPTNPQPDSPSSTPFQPASVDALAKKIETQTQTTGFDGYSDVVSTYIEKCAMAAFEKYSKNRPSSFIVSVRHPMEEYFYRTMSPYLFLNLRAIRKDKQPIPPIAKQSAVDILAMCDSINAIGEHEQQRFEAELLKPQWGPSAAAGVTQ